MMVEGGTAAKFSSSPGAPGPARERVVVRRRRRTRKWVARAPRRLRLRAILICAAVLAVMAAALYVGLAVQSATG